MKKPFKSFVLAPYPKGSVTQYYGENPGLYKAVGMDYHNGVDLVAPYGTPIFAVEGGKVVESLVSPGYGTHCKILSGENEWVYGHLSRLDVKINQKVEEGAQIGLMGNTGFVVSGPNPYMKYNPYAGTHLHLGLRKCRPYKVGESYNIQYQSGDRGTILYYENGAKGSIDWTPMYHEPIPEKPTELPIEPIEPKSQTEIQLTIASLYNQVLILMAKLLEAMKQKSK